MILNADKFGYYTVGELKTYSKLEAIEWHQRWGQFPEWNFNSEIFNSINWRTEPNKNLWQIYIDRCKQIRECYDYVVLFYSGGSDSDNILRAWLASGCPIDEIAVQVNNEGAKRSLELRSDCDWDLEPDMVVKPVINNLQKQGIKFNYREIDISKLQVNMIANMTVDYFYFANTSFSPNNITKCVFREQIQDYKDLIDQGKKLCFVWGSDKPNITFANDSWCFNFTDIHDNCVSPYVQMNYDKGWYDELFYYTPDMPELLVKQCHVLKNFCETVNDKQFYQTKSTNWGYNKTLNMYITEQAVKKIIYPHWDVNTFVARKPYYGGLRSGFGYLGFSERDRWFFNGNFETSKKYEDHFYWVLDKLTKNIKTYDWTSQRSTGSQTIIKGHIQKHYFA